MNACSLMADNASLNNIFDVNVCPWYMMGSSLAPSQQSTGERKPSSVVNRHTSECVKFKHNKCKYYSNSLFLQKGTCHYSNSKESLINRSIKQSINCLLIPYCRLTTGLKGGQSTCIFNGHKIVKSNNSPTELCDDWMPDLRLYPCCLATGCFMMPWRLLTLHSQKSF